MKKTGRWSEMEVGGFVKIAPLPILKETEKAIGVPKLFLPVEEEKVKNAPEKETSRYLFIKLSGWSDRGYLFAVRKDSRGRPELKWLPKSQVKISDNTVVAAKSWLVNDKYLLLDFETYLELIEEVIKERGCEKYLLVPSNINIDIQRKTGVSTKVLRYVWDTAHKVGVDIVKYVQDKCKEGD